MTFEKDLGKLADKMAFQELKKDAKEYKDRNRKLQNIATKKLTMEDILAYRNARKGK